MKKVTIVLPIFNNFEIVKNCIDSILSTINLQAFLSGIILIDDASTDKKLIRYLEEFGSHRMFSLIRNDVNKGFTHSVNIGMMHAKNDDVLLLNSDTVVYGDWLDRMQTVLYHQIKISSVCPLTSHSHLTNYPEPLGNLKLGITDEDIDRLASQVNKNNYAEIYSTVGFCMLINRDCINEIGYFDEENFPRGYGEETDFCLRAGDMGWKHFVAGNVYVKHLGEQSFGSEKKVLVSNMLAKFKKLHPNFQGIEERHIRSNPLWSIRKNLDLARFRKLCLIGEDIVIGVCNWDWLNSHDCQFVLDKNRQQVYLNPRLQKKFPNLHPYQVPIDLAELESDLVFLGAKEIACPADAFEIFNKNFTRVNLKPVFLCPI